jgi:hypothetical protein
MISSPKFITGNSSTVSRDELIFENVLQEGVDIKIGQLTNGRSFDYILKSPGILNGISSNVTHMVFEETVNLPSGWTATIINNEVILNNNNGIDAKYNTPVCFDTPKKIDTNNLDSDKFSEIAEIEDFNEPFYEISQNGNILIIKTLVDIRWLKSENRNFPIIIDPDFSCYNASDGTGWIYDYHTDGELEHTWNHNLNWATSGSYYKVGYYPNYIGSNEYDYAGWARIDISSLGSSIDVTDCDFVAELYSTSTTFMGYWWSTFYYRIIDNDPAAAGQTVGNVASSMNSGTYLASQTYYYNHSGSHSEDL